MRHTFRYLLTAPPAPGATVMLAPADAHHLSRVVRRRAGDPVEMIDADGRVWPAVVVDTGAEARVRLADGPRPGPPPAPVVLAQGLAEWGRLDTLVEKCAELGVPRIVLLTTERTRRVPDPDAWRRRRERLVRVAQAAARQSGQSHLPAVEGLVPAAAALAGPGERVMLDGRGDRPLGAHLAGRPDAAAQLTLLVGPDAGWSGHEVAAARAAGVAVCTLGAATLRAETAGLVAVTLALAAAGHLDGAPDAGATHDGGEP
ncbi:MAG TPA: RsmE family RNA methyltransferase [Miltoncostaeaceae bacterium]|nr:RsmE family RNA methyltransferase [Miltoncostaeaceae bacterium]